MWSIRVQAGRCTFLEDRRPVDLDDAGIVLVLFVHGHGGESNAPTGAAYVGWGGGMRSRVLSFWPAAIRRRRRIRVLADRQDLSASQSQSLEYVTAWHSLFYSKATVYALSLVVLTVAWKAANRQDGYARQCSN